jgi:uncharacterized protein (TIGR02678 family)
MDNEEIKICLSGLMENRVISSQRDPELFRMIKRNMRKLQEICLSDLGNQLLINSDFFKLEKIPEHPEKYMGIENFNSPEDYVMFCYSMAYIEEAGPETPFLLPNLTEALQRTMQYSPDWTSYESRKRLVRVLQQMVSFSIIKVLDGDFLDFDSDENEEALFVVTNYSRYFLRMFPENLQSIDSGEQLQNDFPEKSNHIQVIQRLFFSPGICRTEKTKELFRYMRGQEGYLIDYFEKYSYYDFELSKNLAILTTENRRQGLKYIPDGSSGGDLLMIIGSSLRNKQFDPNDYGEIHMSQSQWQSIVSEAILDNRELLSKVYRERSTSSIAKDLLKQTNQYGMTKLDGDSIVITPIFSRINGQFINK